MYTLVLLFTLMSGSPNGGVALSDLVLPKPYPTKSECEIAGATAEAEFKRPGKGENRGIEDNRLAVRHSCIPYPENK